MKIIIFPKTQQSMMCCHVHQLWTWFFTSYMDWFNIAATMKLKSTMGPSGLCKPPWCFKRSTLCPDFSLSTKSTTTGQKGSVKASEQFCSWTKVLAPKRWEEQELFPDFNMHSHDHICRTSIGQSTRHRCYTYPIPNMFSRRVPSPVLLHQCFGTAVRWETLSLGERWL